MIKKILGRHGQKLVWPVWSWGTKIELGISQEWIDGMDWFFACWYKFKKAISYFWVGLVKNGCGHLFHETLKSAEWVYGFSWFFACWLWCNNFWLDQHRTSYLWLLKIQPAAVVPVSPLAIAGRILWNRISPSFPSDICQGVFLEFDHEISLNFAIN